MPFADVSQFHLTFENVKGGMLSLTAMGGSCSAPVIANTSDTTAQHVIMGPMQEKEESIFALSPPL